MKSAIFSENAGIYLPATWCRIPEDLILHSNYCENFKSYIVEVVYVF